MRSQIKAIVSPIGRWLIARPRYTKRALLAVSDLVLLSIALWLAMSIRYQIAYVPKSPFIAATLFAAPMLGVCTLFSFRIYKNVTRFVGPQGGGLQIAAAISVSILIWSLLLFLTQLQGVPRLVPFLYAAIGTFALWFFRQTAGKLLRTADVSGEAMTAAGVRNVLIYGAGPAGVRLVEALRTTSYYRPLLFVDRTPSLWGQYVAAIRVVNPDRLASSIDDYGIDEVLIALPEANRRERLEVLREIQKYPVTVKLLPALEDIASGRVMVSDLRPVSADDLLGRASIPPDPALLARIVVDKNVLVTGAGGSIGSELVRQIVRQEPKSLVLLDVSEAALYEIDAEIREVLALRSVTDKRTLTPIKTVLASVQDADAVRAVLLENRIDTVFHAAAYKHVPIVEHNFVAGIRNNTFGTKVVADAARACGVERVVLISTDKAVRPTNIMGASKRLAEMVLQAHADDQSSNKPIFTMVRFGNVLDSSGSVVRRFRKQIEAGDAVTVTHPDIIRYFMSIPEAATLVIQAGAMAKGGEVFVLDMGEPVRIDDLARSMIRLSGRQVRDLDNPDGDIEIVYTGLRPGEKMHEELLIAGDVMGTEHPRIMKINEPHFSRSELDRLLASLEDTMRSGNVASLHKLLQAAVEGYIPDTRHLPTASEATLH